MSNFSCMEDCIHLHACRRVQAIGKKHRLLVPRYCDENCDCFLSVDAQTNCVRLDDAISYAHLGTDCSFSLTSSTLCIGEILEDI